MAQPAPVPLARRLTTPQAVVLGLASMIGAGVFGVFAPAAATAGNWLLIGLLIAGFIALCNAMSSAQLAAQYPTSGGTYVFARERLGHSWGFMAGWSFVIGKTASCAAIAMVFAAYVAPEEWRKPVAVAAILAVAAVNHRGITRTARWAMVLVFAVLSVLAGVIAAAWLGHGGERESIAFASSDVSVYAVIQAAGLLFFAFAGYARIATLGEEVRDPQRAIPRAIIASLVMTFAIYAVIAVSVLSTLGPQRLAESTAPLADVVTVRGFDWAEPVIALGAATACLGALLALTTGVSRTILAMAREHDLPNTLAAVHDRFSVPHRAGWLVAVATVVLVLSFDLRHAIGFSSFGVLLYYLLANLSALTQDRPHRRYPRVIAVLGALGCSVLAVTLPVTSVAVGTAVIIVGIAARAGLQRRQQRR